MPMSIANATLGPQPSWDLYADLQLLLQYHFMHNAFLAGALIAIVAGAAGYFMVLRAESFAGHTLAQVGFAGATGALLVGISPIIGLIVFGIGSALGIGLLASEEKGTVRGSPVAVGTILTFCLGLGVLFVQLYSGFAEGVYSILFGTVLGITDKDIELIGATTALALAGLALLGRPLLFASLDPLVAQARGLPVRAISIGFLILLALAVAEAVQVVGTLLIFSLLVTPAAVAMQLTTKPGIAVALSVLLALLFSWSGIAVAYFTPYPVGFFITTFAFGTYVLVRLARMSWRKFLQRTGLYRERALA